MSSQERFPGIKILQEIEERAQNLDEGVSLSELPTILDRLHLAAEKGLPLDGWVDATRLAFLTILDALDKAEDSLDLPESVVTAVLNSVHSDWYHLIPMLPLDSQVNAWNLLDLFYANKVKRHYAESFMREAETFMVSCPVPAVQTAFQLLLRLASSNPKDARIPWILAFLERNSGDEHALVVASVLKNRLDVAFAIRMSDATPRVKDSILELMALNELVTETFGGERVVTLDNTLDPRSLAELREIVASLESQALSIATRLDPRDDFSESFLEFVLARLSTVGGQLVQAIRVFERLINKGFCLVDSSGILATIWIERGYVDDAKAVIDKVIPKIPVVKNGAWPLIVIDELYLMSGGDVPGLDEVPQRFVDKAQSNRTVISRQLDRGFAENKERALSAFWDSRERLLMAYLGRHLKAGDFDATRLEGGSRVISLPQEMAFVTCLEEMPSIPAQTRSVLRQATEKPVPATEVMPHVMELMKQLEVRGHHFVELAKDFPGYAASMTVAKERLAAATKNPSSVLEVLNKYVSLPSTPDHLLIWIFDNSKQVLAKGGLRKEALEIGVLLWRQMRGESGRQMNAMCRTLAFEGLNDPTCRPQWPDYIEVILDLMPDHTVQKELWEWFEEHFAKGPPDEIKLGLTLRLAGRLEAPFQSWARALAKEGIDVHLKTLATLNGPGARRTVLEKLIELGGTSAVVVEIIGDWLMTNPNIPSNEIVDLGEWLLPALPNPEPVKAFIREILLAKLAKSEAVDEQKTIVERLFRITPDDPKLAAIIRDIESGKKRFKWILIATAGTAVVIIIILALIFI
ncbi:MAG TPA: hypothetical protein PLJ73_01070 [Myxococcota bacterium]|nr:hypothetical protein [Myxococcota bacterium]